MGFSVRWLLRCLPAISAFSIILLTVAAFTDFPSLLVGPWSGHSSKALRLARVNQWTIAQAVWAFYVVLLHYLTWHYNARLLWAMVRTTSRVKRVADAEARTEDNEKKIEGEENVMHVIMLPAYREDVGTLQETLDVFASHDMASSTYHVYLAMEEKDPNAVSVATDLMPRYEGKFKDIMYTVHPSGIPGEAPGKSSNISWAAKHAVQRFSAHPNRQNIILTVMDADTHLMNTYFRLVNRLHLKAPNDANNTIFAPPIVFDRNSHKVPSFVRMADLLWCGATMSGLFPGSVIGTPTSVYSVPLALVERVQGWDVDPGAIGEDLHMMIKCFFRTCGTLVVKPIYSPASQCNVCSELHGWRGYLDSMRARWRQAIRHMWGSLDTGYAYERGIELVREARDGNQNSPLPYSEPKRHDRPLLTWSCFVWRFLPLYHRLFEAHMLPMHLTSALMLSMLYTSFTPAVVTPFVISTALNVTGLMRAFSFFQMLCALILYERYHALSVGLRERAMRRAGLDCDPDTFSKRTSWLYCLDYFMFPVGGIIFGAIPAIVAQTCHFWTDQLVYQVSAKPKRVVLTDAGAILVDASLADAIVNEKLGMFEVDTQSLGSRSSSSLSG